MSRIARKNFDTSFFHVITQGINKEYIFEKEEDRKKYLYFLNKYIEDYKIEILAYCLMHNHAHLLIYTEKITEMSKYMLKVNSIYAQYYNKISNRVGYVFRDRFISQPIETEEGLWRCINYIHLNPVKAKIVEKPGLYKYSSFNDYIMKTGVAENKILNSIFDLNNYLDFFKEENFDNCFIDIDFNEKTIINECLGNFMLKNSITFEEITSDDQICFDCINFLMSRYNFKRKNLIEGLKISKYRFLKIQKIANT